MVGGFTLIEAVAALAICATALTGLLAVRHRLLRQAQQAAQVAQANVVAGELVGDWRSRQLVVEPGERVRGEDEGTGLAWQARCEQAQLTEGVFMHSLEVAVYPADADSRGDKPLVAIEAWQPIDGALR